MIKLKCWSIIKLGEGLFSLQGIRMDENTWWYSSGIKKRIDHVTLESCSGNKYLLVGPMLMLCNENKKDFSKVIMNKFKDGFPRRWRCVLNTWLISDSKENVNCDKYNEIEMDVLLTPQRNNATSFRKNCSQDNKIFNVRQKSPNALYEVDDLLLSHSKNKNISKEETTLVLHSKECNEGLLKKYYLRENINAPPEITILKRNNKTNDTLKNSNQLLNEKNDVLQNFDKLLHKKNGPSKNSDKLLNKKNEASKNSDKLLNKKNILQNSDKLLNKKNDVLQNSDKLLNKKNGPSKNSEKLLNKKNEASKNSDKLLNKKNEASKNSDKLLNKKNDVFPNSDKLLNKKNGPSKNSDKLLNKKNEASKNSDKLLNKKNILQNSDKLLNKKNDVLQNSDKLLNKKNDVLQNSDKLLNKKNDVLQNSDKLLNKKNKASKNSDKLLIKKNDVLQNSDKLLYKKNKAPKNSDKLLNGNLHHMVPSNLSESQPNNKNLKNKYKNVSRSDQRKNSKSKFIENTNVEINHSMQNSKKRKTVLKRLQPNKKPVSDLIEVNVSQTRKNVKSKPLKTKGYVNKVKTNTLGGKNTLKRRRVLKQMISEYHKLQPGNVWNVLFPSTGTNKQVDNIEARLASQFSKDPSSIVMNKNLITNSILFGQSPGFNSSTPNLLNETPNLLNNTPAAVCQDTPTATHFKDVDKEIFHAKKLKLDQDNTHKCLPLRNEAPSSKLPLLKADRVSNVNRKKYDHLPNKTLVNLFQPENNQGDEDEEGNEDNYFNETLEMMDVSVENKLT